MATSAAVANTGAGGDPNGALALLLAAGESRSSRSKRSSASLKGLDHGCTLVYIIILIVDVVLMYLRKNMRVVN